MCSQRVNGCDIGIVHPLFSFSRQVPFILKFYALDDLLVRFLLVVRPRASEEAATIEVPMLLDEEENALATPPEPPCSRLVVGRRGPAQTALALPPLHDTALANEQRRDGPLADAPRPAPPAWPPAVAPAHVHVLSPPRSTPLCHPVRPPARSPTPRCTS